MVTCKHVINRYVVTCDIGTTVDVDLEQVIPRGLDHADSEFEDRLSLSVDPKKLLVSETSCF